jgi:hypothetical protein
MENTVDAKPRSNRLDNILVIANSPKSREHYLRDSCEGSARSNTTSAPHTRNAAQLLLTAPLHPTMTYGSRTMKT